MKIFGECNELLKIKATREANDIIETLKRGNIEEVYQKTQLSWRKEKKYLFGLIKTRPKINNVFIPEFKTWIIEKIYFQSYVMIDVFVRLDDKLYRIRMVSEKKPYITDPQARFRFNPASIRLWKEPSIKNVNRNIAMGAVIGHKFKKQG